MIVCKEEEDGEGEGERKNEAKKGKILGEDFEYRGRLRARS